jgi:hypothetical protein
MGWMMQWEPRLIQIVHTWILGYLIRSYLEGERSWDTFGVPCSVILKFEPIGLSNCNSGELEKVLTEQA